MNDMTSAARVSPIYAFASDIKLSHSIFAMPFALLAMVMAADATLPQRRPTLPQVGLILACMVIARSFAMGMNRLIDARGDALNPRTAGRAIPAGRLSHRAAFTILIVCAIAFQATTLGFGLIYANWLPAMLAMPVLALLGAYPYFKRFTRLCHYYLGFCLALAPVCAWIAIAGRVDKEPLLMAAAVLCWTAGFDILYACQDYAHDVATGVFSVPAKLGITKALWVARITHVACALLLVEIGVASKPLDLLWLIAVCVVAFIFCIEHAIVRADDLSKVNIAFFTLNGIVALTLGTCGIVDVLFV